jgi:GT2 family glycosyltransferase
MLERLNRLGDTRADWGAVEARQIPLEHPKKFDEITLETLSLTTAAAVIHGPTFEKIGGFDEIFFMYGDDVDLGWRLRGQGCKLYYAIDTFIYHTKRLEQQGVVASSAEKFYLPLTNLILWSKYGRPDLIESALQYFNANLSDPYLSRVVKEWEQVCPKIKPATQSEKAAAAFDRDGTAHLHRWWY